MGLCACSLSLGNTGLPNCQPIFSAGTKLIIVPTYDADGNLNYIDPADTLNAAYFSALVNNTDGSLRWYPLPKMKNVTDERGDAKYQEFDDGTKAFIQQGARPFVGLIPEGTPQLLGKIENYRCSEISAFVVDINRNIIGKQISTDGFLYPIKIDNDSWNPKFVKSTTAGTISGLMLEFNWDIDEQDSDLRFISANQISINLLSLNGLVDATIEVVSTGQTSMVFRVLTDAGEIGNPVRVKGLAAADFYDTVGGTASRLYNVTDSSAVTISALTEGTGTSEGEYTATYVSQTVSDVIRVTPNKAGYSFTANTGTVV